MADPSKTEKATPKRRGEARRKGQVAKSPDLGTSIVLLAGIVTVSMLGHSVVQDAGGAMQAIFGLIANPSAATSAAGLHSISQIVIHTMLTTAAPISGVCMATGIIVNVAQIGLKGPSWSALKPDLKRLNPVGGFKKLFSARSAFETGKNLIKIGVVGAIVAMTLIPQLTSLGASVGTPAGALGTMMSATALGIAERAVAIYLLIGIIDLIWQRRQYAKGLRMTKQEVKEEAKQADLPAEVKGAIRRRQFQAARARMMAAVPKADVVVTNPTHYAVALSYDGTHPAPVVVAKGQNLVALQIRRIAQESSVPVVSDPRLARSLHATVELGQMIPIELYAAVAQVLAFVYRMAGRRRARA